MPQIAKVAVAAATYAIDKPYDYLIPQGTDIAVGMRVLVPFGRGNRVSEGVVLALGQGVPDKPIKPIRSVVDREPVITDREIRLALWMRERYFCTFYDAIRTILPAAVWYSYREMWSLTGEPLPEDLSEREAAACRLLQDGPMERDDLCAALGETGGRVLSVLKKRLWTLKEALIKCRGGVLGQIRHVHFDLSGSSIICSVPGYSFSLLPAPAGFAAALCWENIEEAAESEEQK